MEQKAVIVTTKHRGIFCGLLNADTAAEAQTVTLNRCRMAVTFKNTGAVGLAQGPTGRVSGMAPSAEIRDITAIFDCSEEGWKAWDAVDEKKGKS